MVVLMVVTTAAFVIMIVFVLMVMTAAALMVVVMLMMVTAAALMIMVMLMVVTAAAFVIVVVIVVMATAAFVAMIMLVFMVRLMTGRLLALGISGINHSTAFHRPGNPGQLRNQGIGVFRRKPQLLCGKGNDGFLHIFMIVEFLLDLRCTVGAVQIFDDIYFPGHSDPSCF